MEPPTLRQMSILRDIRAGKTIRYRVTGRSMARYEADGQKYAVSGNSIRGLLGRGLIRENHLTDDGTTIFELTEEGYRAGRVGPP